MLANISYIVDFLKYNSFAMLWRLNRLLCRPLYVCLNNFEMLLAPWQPCLLLPYICVRHPELKLSINNIWLFPGPYVNA